MWPKVVGWGTGWVAGGGIGMWGAVDGAPTLEWITLHNVFLGMLAIDQPRCHVREGQFINRPYRYAKSVLEHE